MLIYNGEIIKQNKCKYFSNADFEVYYKGIVFVSGKKEGNESIEFIFKNILLQEHRDFSHIYGNYFIYLIDKTSNTQYFFTDNSGIFKSYRYKHCISTSFLEIINLFPEITINNININAVAEFFHYGFTYLQSTLVNGIERIDKNSYFVIDSSEISCFSKGLENINSPANININSFFNDLAFAIGNKKISIDLTGGFDSRLLLSYFLKNNKDFELAISGLQGNVDIGIAKNISKKINRAFYATIHKVEENTMPGLADLFKTTDAQIDLIEYHRNNQLNTERKRRNIDIQISGVGGELYKDFWWLQDFPFYNNKKTNIEKLYNLRIESTPFPSHLLGDKLHMASAKLKQETLLKLKQYVLSSNTQTYDNIYFNYKMHTNAGVYLTLANQYFDSYAPLLELELVKLGFSLKRGKRFYNNFHRKIISENAPELSRIRTTEGITCSNSFVYKLTDLAFYIIDKAKRVIKQILRKLIKKTYLQDSPNDNRIYDYSKNSTLFSEHLELLQKHKLISENTNEKNIPNRMVGKIITLGFLIQILEDNNSE